MGEAGRFPAPGIPARIIVAVAPETAMPTYLLTVETCRRSPHGLGVYPGIRADEVDRRPAFARMKGGASIVLVQPNGLTRRTRLVSYGLPSRPDPDDLYLVGAAGAAELCLVLPRELSPDDVPAGTELWLVDGARH